ncbi:hypothetical protein C8R45DRAFT_842148 [Mycena sanguinolenta]|nr:hypothetical protein C8R45DRAFT_842148 [Mycena sanguinolenta]
MQLVDRYATQAAIQASLFEDESTDQDRTNRVPAGSPWVTPSISVDDSGEPPGLVDIEEPQTPRNQSAPLPSKAAEDAPQVHKERANFTGDRVLRNSQIFMQDFGWWIEFAHAVPEGDIGRVWEIMKIWIFKFAGSSHANYVNYLLEVYCMLRYEASKDLKNGILNNWLLNIKGELGRFIPGDLHQEHYNKWHEHMMKKHGGEFDDPFYRQTISPNVHHFLQIKQEVESAFDFKHRGQTHTSPPLRDELQLLMKMFKDEEVHLFRARRSLGHAAVNQFARGWLRLDEEKLGTFLTKSTILGDFLQQVRTLDVEDDDMRTVSPAPSSSSTAHSSSSSMDSLARTDADEPDDNGEDLSDAHLTSGSGLVFTVDPETGMLLVEDEVEPVEDEETNESDGEEEEEVDESLRKTTSQRAIAARMRSRKLQIFIALFL